MLRLVSSTEHATHRDVKNELLDALKSRDAESDEYAELLSRYKTLCEIEAINKPERAGLKAWIPAIGNVAGIIVMGVFEIKGPAIFTSKALNLFGGKLLK